MSSLQPQGQIYLHLAKDVGRSRASSFAESDFDDYYEDEPDGFSVLEAAFSIASSMIGAGIVSVPYSLTVMGLQSGILIHFTVFAVLAISSHLYITAKHMFDVDSFNELSYQCFGSISVYVINIVITVLIYGVIL